MRTHTITTTTTNTVTTATPEGRGHSLLGVVVPLGAAAATIGALVLSGVL